MDVHNTIGGSLQISTEVIAKIARLAALEVDGVSDVATGHQPERPFATGPYRPAEARHRRYGRMALPPSRYTSRCVRQ